MAPAGSILLTEAPLDVPLRVTGVNAGREAQSRLASMGILPGEIVRIVRRENGGPLLLEVKGTRVALGRGVSLKVTVTNGQ
jgi:Fe2+ transport system protein FeoA